MILKRYENTGNIFESKADQKTRHIVEKIEKEMAHPEPVFDSKFQFDQSQVPVTFMPFVCLYYPPTTMAWPLTY